MNRITRISEILWSVVAVFLLLHSAFMWLCRPYILQTGDRYFDYFVNVITSKVFLCIWTVIPLIILACCVYRLNMKLIRKW